MINYKNCWSNCLYTYNRLRYYTTIQEYWTGLIIENLLLTFSEKWTVYWFINFLKWMHSDLIGCKGKNKPESSIDKKPHNKLQGGNCRPMAYVQATGLSCSAGWEQDDREDTLQLVLGQESPNKWTMCKGGEPEEGQHPRRIKLLQWTFLKILNCSFLLEWFVTL